MDIQRQYIGARYVPKFFENPDGSSEWVANTYYEPLTIVTYNAATYTSKIPVPNNVGNPTSNPEYWVLTANYNAQIEHVKDQMIEVVNQRTAINPDDFIGLTDAQKLQKAINYAITHDSSTINITRKYDITGSTLMMDKGLYYTSDERVRYRAKLTFIGNAEGCIYKGDTGYFFSANNYSGDFQFINVHFEGNVVLGGEDDISARKSGCHVFDCSKLIRITTIGCSFTLLDTVFDGSRTVDTSSNMQSIRSIGDLVTYSNRVATVILCWDVNFIGLTAEIINTCFATKEVGYVNVSHVNFNNCCIEGCKERGILIAGETGTVYVSNLNIKDCYFEEIPNACISIFEKNNVNALNIDGCRFAQTQGNGIAINPISWEGCSIRNCVLSGSTTGTLIYTVGTQPIYVYNCAPSSKYSNNRNLTPMLHQNGSMYGWPKNVAGMVNLDTPTSTNGCAIVADIAGFTGDCLVTWHYLEALGIEFATDGVTLKQRTRKPGIGWSAWKSLELT